MLSYYLTLALLATILGAFGKYADLLNEHGMKPLLKEPPLLSGIIWGGAGVLIMLLSPAAGITYVAHVLYWFLRVKLEYPNHACAGVMILLGAFILQNDYLAAHPYQLLAVFLGYTITGYLHVYLKEHVPSLTQFLRLRLRIYLVALIYSLYISNIDPFFTTCCGMIACEIVTKYLPEKIKIC